MYITIHPKFNDGFRISYSEVEDVKNVAEIKHEIARVSLQMLAVNFPLEISSIAEIPSHGSGLGSSSSYTVGLINAIETHKGSRLTPVRLAELATHVEIALCNQPIGKQDQYAAAYGGFNVIRFDASGVEVTPLNIGASVLRKLNDNFMCYSTGISRNTADILSDQINNITNDVDAFNNTTKLVYLAKQALNYLNKNKIDDFGALLDEAWQIKKKLSNKISNSDIDFMYQRGINAGALGGKLLGAGGGGYMLFYVPESSRGSVSLAMREYKRFHINFTDEGSVACRV
jgi:D-glycero-alpha-D-manno-heptose-7-phosphate kinase